MAHNNGARFFGGETADFWRCFYAGTYFIARHVSNAFDDVFGLAHMEAYLFTVRPDAVPDQLEVVRQRARRTDEIVTDPQQLSERPGQPQSVDDVLRLYAQGYSVILNGVEIRWPSVARLNADVMDLFGLRANANLYFTPPGSAAFPPHFDPMHALVVQLEGAKHWRIYADVPTDIAREQCRVPRDQLGPATEITLHAGDVLYIPPGLRHEASTTASHSCHVTFGITEPSDAGLLAHLLGDSHRLLERRARPPETNGRWPSQDRLRSVIDFALQDDRRMDLESATEALLARECERTTAAPGTYLETLLSLDSLERASRLRRRLGLRTMIRARDDGSVAVLSALEPMGFPAEFGPALTMMLSGQAFQVRELPGLSGRAQVRLARWFVVRGLLELLTDAAEGDPR